jgi:hypothetical protein
MCQIIFLRLIAKSWIQWHIPVIPTLRRLKQKDLEFEVSLGYITTLTQKKKLIPKSEMVGPKCVTIFKVLTHNTKPQSRIIVPMNPSVSCTVQCHTVPFALSPPTLREH